MAIWLDSACHYDASAEIFLTLLHVSLPWYKRAKSSSKLDEDFVLYLEACRWSRR